MTSVDLLLHEAVKCLQHAQKSDHVQTDDADDVFGKMVASELRTITDPVEKRRIKRLIQNALFEEPRQHPNYDSAYLQHQHNTTEFQTTNQNSYVPIYYNL